MYYVQNTYLNSLKNKKSRKTKLNKSQIYEIRIITLKFVFDVYKNILVRNNCFKIHVILILNNI